MRIFGNKISLSWNLAKQHVWGLTFLAATLVFLTTWSSLPALSAWFAAITMEPVKPSDLQSLEQVHEVRRRIQKHFLRYDLYLPLEDIVFAEESERLKFFMRNSCGQAKIYVWVPMKFRIPGYGPKTIEWCWRPT